MKNNGFWISALICVLLLFSSCARKVEDERYSSPRKTYSLWLEVSIKGDIAATMECLTKASQKFMDIQAKNRDLFIARMVEYSMVFERYEVSEEKIKGDKAVVVILEPDSKNVIAIPFQYEDGWKVDLIAMFSGMAAGGSSR